ncbi:glycine zipper domain-containing protein [Haloferula chungangensis]|uniref:Glycine zipper domain-containing protein n=1 Tax=Haloferula chungangensis TaxID=1048331 RepID=A0ABW2L0Z1_9BACT
MKKDHLSKRDEDARNEDPITGEPGSHPVGVGVGTAGGAATGAAIGAAGGPAGAAVGALVGGIAGAYTGKGIAEELDPTLEEDYWRKNHSSQDWANDPDNTYDDYEPAYRYGYTQAAARRSKWDENESELEKDWDQFKGKSRLKWEKAKQATRASWHRIESKLPGDADGDGI